MGSYSNPPKNALLIKLQNKWPVTGYSPGHRPTYTKGLVTDAEIQVYPIQD